MEATNGEAQEMPRSKLWQVAPPGNKREVTHEMPRRMRYPGPGDEVQQVQRGCAMTAIARWESRFGKHWVTVDYDGKYYSFHHDGGGGSLQATNNADAIDETLPELGYLFPDRQKTIKRVQVTQ